MKHKILVVDDDQNLLESYKFLLSVSGFVPFLAQDSKQAKKILEEHNISVALIDLKLKKEDGLCLIDTFKKEFPDIELILITAYPSYETAVEAIKLGAFDYLSKTQEPEEIIESIRNAIEDKEKKNFSKDKTEIAIIVNNSFIKKGIEIFLEKHDFLLKVSFNSLREFLDNYSESSIEVVLLCGVCFFDKTTKNFPLLKELVKRFPDEKVVIFNHNFSEKQIKELIKIGIKGFINVNANEAKFIQVVKDVIEGKIIAPEDTIVQALNELSRIYAKSTGVSSTSSVSLLTEREREILKYMAQGLRNKELAEKLFISEKTVKTHINRIFKKLKVKSRLQAIIKATENNLLF